MQKHTLPRRHTSSSTVFAPTVTMVLEETYTGRASYFLILLPTPALCYPHQPKQYVTHWVTKLQYTLHSYAPDR